MSKVYICPTCQQPFQQRRQFRRHSSTHKGSPFNQAFRPTANEEKRSLPPLQSSSTPNQSKKPSRDVQIMRETSITNPFGLPLGGPNTSTAEGMEEWLECFWPGYIGTLLKPSLHTEEHDLRADAKLDKDGHDAREEQIHKEEYHGSSSSSSEGGNSRSTVLSPGHSPVGATAF